MKITCHSKDLSHPDRYCPPALGNGELSMLVDYQGGTTPKQYCDNNITSGIWRAGYRYDSADCGWKLVPFGFFEQEFETPVEVADWKQTLDIDCSATESECRYTDGTVVKSYVCCHLQHNLLIIRKTTSGSAPIRMRYSFAPRQTRVQPLSDTKLGYEVTTWEGIRGTIAFFSPDSDVTASQGADGITLSTSKSSALFYLAFDEEAEFYARTHSIEEIEESNRAAWSAFWQESTLPVDKLPERVLQAARVAEYHLRISTTKWSIPVGIFPEHWDGKYFAFDEFFAMGGLLASGHLELARHVPRYRFSQLDEYIYRAYYYFDKDIGAARCYWQTIEKAGIECGGRGFWAEHIFHLATISVGAWNCSLRGKDLDFLRQTAYPLIRAFAEFYRIFSVDEKCNGKYIVGKCTDLERLGAARENAFMTTCGVIATFRIAATAAQLLNVDSELQEKWKRLAEKLTETLPQNERVYLVYPGSEEKSIGLLSGIFPFENLPLDDAKQLQCLEDFCATESTSGNMYPIGKSVCAWYAGWKAITMRRLGQIEKAQLTVQQMAADTGHFAETFEIYELGHHPWFCTAEGVLLQAVCEAYR